MSDLICGLIALVVAMPTAAWLLPKLNLYRDSLVCGLCNRVLPGSRNAHPRPDVARCRNCRIHEEQQIATLVATDESELFGRPTQRSTSSRSLPKNRNEGMSMITDIWDCTRCKKTVTASGKSFWLIRGDLMLRFRCANCKARRDREPTEEERDLIAAGVTAKGKRPRLPTKTLARHIKGTAGAMRVRRANRRELRAFERKFLAQLAARDELSEVVRSEGGWRSNPDSD